MFVRLVRTAARSSNACKAAQRSTQRHMSAAAASSSSVLDSYPDKRAAELIKAYSEGRPTTLSVDEQVAFLRDYAVQRPPEDGIDEKVVEKFGDEQVDIDSDGNFTFQNESQEAKVRHFAARAEFWEPKGKLISEELEAVLKEHLDKGENIAPWQLFNGFLGEEGLTVEPESQMEEKDEIDNDEDPGGLDKTAKQFPHWSPMMITDSPIEGLEYEARGRRNGEEYVVALPHWTIEFVLPVPFDLHLFNETPVVKECPEKHSETYQPLPLKNVPEEAYEYLEQELGRPVKRFQ